MADSENQSLRAKLIIYIEREEEMGGEGGKGQMGGVGGVGVGGARGKGSGTDRVEKWRGHNSKCYGTVTSLFMGGREGNNGTLNNQ